MKNDAAYYRRNKEQIRARRIARIRANPEKVAQRNRESYVKYRERILAAKKRHRERFRIEYAARAKAKRAAAPEPAHDYLKRNHGLSIAQYRDMLARQEGKCAICKGEQQNKRRFAVDHCHATGLIRGLLCTNCNTSIGKFNDDPALLERAAAYLRGSK